MKNCICKAISLVSLLFIATSASAAVIIKSKSARTNLAGKNPFIGFVTGVSYEPGYNNHDSSIMISISDKNNEELGVMFQKDDLIAGSSFLNSMGAQLNVTYTDSGLISAIYRYDDNQIPSIAFRMIDPDHAKSN